MKIFGFGEDKKDRIDNIFVKEELSNELDPSEEDKEKDKEEDEEIDKEEEKDSDYIDMEDLGYYEYEDIIEEIENKGWNLISSTGLYPITQFNTDIVLKYTVKRHTYDKFLEIICPPGNLITVCGFNQEDIDEDAFFNSPNLYTIPHFFAIKLSDDESEILSTTIIGISKINRKGDIEKLYQEFYGDLSSTTDGKLKKKEDRYYFGETIILQVGEKLVFHAYWPHTDISKIELLMMANVFIKTKE